MIELNRYAISGEHFEVYRDSGGEFVQYEDYDALQQQLTATTNSLTNAQEALKSAGIEADTVQAGVMELKAQLDALAVLTRDNAVLAREIVYRLVDVGEADPDVVDSYQVWVLRKLNGVKS